LSGFCGLGFGKVILKGSVTLAHLLADLVLTIYYCAELRSRIYEYYESQKRAERDSQRKAMIGSGDRSQKIRSYNYPQNRLTDHRINLSLYSLDKIMTGDMGELVAALKDYDKQQRLKNL